MYSLFPRTLLAFQFCMPDQEGGHKTWDETSNEVLDASKQSDHNIVGVLAPVHCT